MGDVAKGPVVLLWGLTLAVGPAVIAAQERSFHGVYAGVEVASEDFIGGSYVDGTDFLSQDMRGVVSLTGGARLQTSIGVVLGVEGTWGWTDGDLTLDDPARDLSIEYASDTQRSIGGMVGFAVQRSLPFLIFAYASEVTRHFDVHVTQGVADFTQEDEQGQLRYGLGVEVSPIDHVNVRFRMGSGRADFGNAETNVTPEKQLQYGIGVLVQF